MKRRMLCAMLCVMVVLAGCDARQVPGLVANAPGQAESQTEEALTDVATSSEMTELSGMTGMTELPGMTEGEGMTELPGMTEWPSGKVEPTAPTAPTAPVEPEQESDDGWMLRLVNVNNGLPNDFAPELAEIEDGYPVDARIAPHLLRMIAQAKTEGVELVVCSGYRPYSSQERNYNASIQNYLKEGYSEGEALAMTRAYYALPGHSEHQTGLAVDIVTPSYIKLDSGYAETDAAKWLYANAADYGFILRYPKDKVEITGIAFEPWHYRYVGEVAAKEIMKQKICLEEYLAE